MKQNFLDKLDGGWGDLIADTYSKNNIVLFDITNSTINVNLYNNEEETSYGYTILMYDNLLVNRIRNREGEPTADLDYKTKDDYIRFRIFVKPEDIIIDDMTLQEFISNKYFDKFSLEDEEEVISLWFESNRNGFVNCEGSIVYNTTKETKCNGQSDGNTIMADSLLDKLFN